MPTEEQRIQAAKIRYQEAAHGVQTGVRAELELAGYPAAQVGPCEAAGNVKHLRTGINSAMVETSVLAKLMVERKLITWAEYYEALADGMVAERDKYEKLLTEKLDHKVTLS